MLSFFHFLKYVFIFIVTFSDNIPDFSITIGYRKPINVLVILYVFANFANLMYFICPHMPTSQVRSA